MKSRSQNRPLKSLIHADDDDDDDIKPFLLGIKVPVSCEQDY
jgi:hypothetical protein